MILGYRNPHPSDNECVHAAASMERFWTVKYLHFEKSSQGQLVFSDGYSAGRRNMTIVCRLHTISRMRYTYIIFQPSHQDIQTTHKLKVITERMSLLSRGDAEANKRSFLDLLIAEKSKENLSLEDIREEVDIFMFAGTILSFYYFWT